LLTGLMFAMALQTAPKGACALGEGVPIETGAWSDVAPMVDPAGELRKRDSTPKDMLASVALPGLGELRSGRRGWAIAHIAAETAVWVSFVVFRVQGELRKDDYIEYAEVYGGVRDADGRSEEYYRNLAKYRRSDPGPDSYNEREVRETARVLFPDDLQARKDYIDRNMITGPLAWSWESDAHWRSFAELRSSSERSFQRSRFCFAAAIANRIVSVLGLARHHGPGGTEIGTRMEPLGGDGSLVPAVSVRFDF